MTADPANACLIATPLERVSDSNSLGILIFQMPLMTADPANACLILVAAAKFDAQELKRHCKDYILKHSTEVSCGSSLPVGYSSAIVDAVQLLFCTVVIATRRTRSPLEYCISSCIVPLSV